MAATGSSASRRIPRSSFSRGALERLHASRAATVRLTALFEQAKFSDHVIDESMRGEALQALAGLRSELAQESV